MSEETTNADMKVPQIPQPKADIPNAAATPQESAAPKAGSFELPKSPTPQFTLPKAQIAEPAAPKAAFELPKAPRAGIPIRSAAPIPPQAINIAVAEGPGKISIAIDFLAAVVAVAFAALIVLDI